MPYSHANLPSDLSPYIPSRRQRYATIELTTTVELQSGLKRNPLLGGAGLGVSLLSGVKSVDIGLVVLLVVKLHNLLVDERLEPIVGIREVGESVSGHCECRGDDSKSS